MSGEKFPRKDINTQFEFELDWGTGTVEELVTDIDTRSEEEREDAELDKGAKDLWDLAHEFHLDPHPTHFEIASPKIVNQIGAYGVPGRFGHWTFGREYAKMKTQYEHGLMRIYELVVNGNPSKAFLAENNPVIENKFIMAHVYGHTDFFKNNFRFGPTRDDMLEIVEENADRMRRYEELYGERVVEEFIDHVIALDDHVDPYSPDRPWKDEEIRRWGDEARAAIESARNSGDVGEFADVIHSDEVAAETTPYRRSDLKIPPEPETDILGFIRNHSEYLEDWQRDVVNIIRSESIYFFPQRRTKIMNEGWAAYWHKRLMLEMTNRGLVTNAEGEVWRRLHAGVVSESKGSLNPYHLGMKMYEYLEDYYNGNLSEEETKWLQSQGATTYPHFDGPLQDSPASTKLRQVMMMNDDQSLIRNYFDKNIADRMHMYVFEEKEVYGQTIRVVKPSGWKDVREKLVTMLDNNGTPHIEVVNGDYNKSSQLYLRHGFDGRTLDVSYINKTLPHLYSLWHRTVHLETVRELNGQQRAVIYSYNGTSISIKDIGPKKYSEYLS